MFKIRTMNTISPLGTQILEKHGCEVGPRVDNPQALLIRSADLHSTEFWPELLCIGRAGAGTNNIPVEQCAEQGIVVFNALPHFPDPERLLRSLTARLAPGGRLTVAHDRCRAAVNGWHEQTAGEVSLGLPPAETVAQWMSAALEVDTVVDGEDVYVISGVGLPL